MKKIVLILMLVVIGAGILLPVADSQAAINLMQNVGGDCKSKGDCTLCDMVRVVYNVGRLIFAMMVGIAMILFLCGSIGLIINWGNAEMIAANKKLLVNTVIAIAVIMLAWVLVNAVIVYILGAHSSYFEGQHWYNGPKCS